MKIIPLNTDNSGNASTILAGYFKYGVATLIGGGGASEQVVLASLKYMKKILAFVSRNPEKNYGKAAWNKVAGTILATDYKAPPYA